MVGDIQSMSISKLLLDVDGQLFFSSYFVLCFLLFCDLLFVILLFYDLVIRFFRSFD